MEANSRVNCRSSLATYSLNRSRLSSAVAAIHRELVSFPSEKLVSLLSTVVSSREEYLAADKHLTSLLEKYGRAEQAGRLKAKDLSTLNVILSILFEGECDLYPDKRDDLYRLEVRLATCLSILDRVRGENSNSETVHMVKRMVFSTTASISQLMSIYTLIHPRHPTSHELDNTLQICRGILQELSNSNAELSPLKSHMKSQLSFYLNTACEERRRLWLQQFMIKRKQLELRLHNLDALSIAGDGLSDETLRVVTELRDFIQLIDRVAKDVSDDSEPSTVVEWNIDSFIVKRSIRFRDTTLTAREREANIDEAVGEVSKATFSVFQVCRLIECPALAEANLVPHLFARSLYDVIREWIVTRQLTAYNFRRRILQNPIFINTTVELFYKTMRYISLLPPIVTAISTVESR